MNGYAEHMRHSNERLHEWLQELCSGQRRVTISGLMSKTDYELIRQRAERNGLTVEEELKRIIWEKMHPPRKRVNREKIAVQTLRDKKWKEDPDLRLAHLTEDAEVLDACPSLFRDPKTGKLTEGARNTLEKWLREGADRRFLNRRGAPKKKK
ncbi:MAG: hypothetical protein LDL33_15790 [Desulfomonile sp.]|nr:hypothetical protein [Desulfomonile sp.]